jgi:hypothetical protein
LNSFNNSIHHRRQQRKDENATGTEPFVGAEYIRDLPNVSTKNSVGSDLTAGDYAALEARWIDRRLADLAGLRRVDSLTGAEIVGRKNGNYAGIVIP